MNSDYPNLFYNIWNIMLASQNCHEVCHANLWSWCLLYHGISNVSEPCKHSLKFWTLRGSKLGSMLNFVSWLASWEQTSQVCNVLQNFATKSATFAVNQCEIDCNSQISTQNWADNWQKGQKLTDYWQIKPNF